MPAPYNDSFMDNATSIVDLIKGIGVTIDQPYLFGYLTMMGFFLIYLILSMKNDVTKVIITDAFLTTVLGILLFIVGIVPAAAFIVPLVLLLITLIIYLFME
jgi:hypothetical protein